LQQSLSTVFKEVIVPLFDPKFPKMMKINHTEPFFMFCFLQSVYNNYLDHVKKNNGKLVTKNLDMICAWKGGSAAECKQHLIDVQALMAKVSRQLSSTCDHNLVINLIIEKLVEDPKLEAGHTVRVIRCTVIRSRYNDDPAKVTFAYIEREITLILLDSSKRVWQNYCRNISG
jgi:hypothetical protein